MTTLQSDFRIHTVSTTITTLTIACDNCDTEVKVRLGIGMSEENYEDFFFAIHNCRQI